jgi:hypothetical protein
LVNWEVQLGKRLAFTETLEAKRRHSLVTGVAAGTAADTDFRAFDWAIGRTTRKRNTAAIIKMLVMVLMKISKVSVRILSSSDLLQIDLFLNNIRFHG